MNFIERILGTSKEKSKAQLHAAMDEITRKFDKIEQPQADQNISFSLIIECHKNGTVVSRMFPNDQNLQLDDNFITNMAALLIYTKKNIIKTMIDLLAQKVSPDIAQKVKIKMEELRPTDKPLVDSSQVIRNFLGGGGE